MKGNFTDRPVKKRLISIFRPQLNFFYKLLLFFILISLVPLLINAVFSYGFLSNFLRNDLSKSAYIRIAKISQNIDRLIAEYGETVNLLAKDQAIQEALLRESTADYDRIYREIFLSMAGKKTKTGVYVITERGKAIFATHAIPKLYDVVTYKDWGIFRLANATPDNYVIYAHNYTDSNGDSIVLSLAKAVRDRKGLPIGYVIVEIYKNQLLDIFDNVSNDLSMNFMLLDQNFYTVTNLINPKLEGNFYNPPFRKQVGFKGSGTIIAKTNAKQSLISFQTSKSTKFITMGILPLDAVMQYENFIKMVTLFAFLASLIVCLVLALLLARNISQPIESLVTQMKQVEDGDLNAQVNFKRWDELGLLGQSFNNMVVRIKDLLGKVLEKQQRIRIAELKALQAQINPHFLYNTLDAIKWLAKLNNIKEISVIATRLGKLLRNSINSEGDISTVAESLDLIESYLEIQKIRYRDKFETTINISPEITDCRIPKLLLQPLVENAIIHGLEGKIGKGSLQIKGFKQHG